MFGLSLAQALGSILRCAGQSASFGPPGRPLLAWDQIRLGVGVSTAAIYPDVACA